MGWLSLKVQEARSARVWISAPKKILPRAVDRNRLKRLIREVTRADAYFKSPSVFWFRVTAPAPKLKCQDVRRVVESLKKAVKA